MNGGFSWPCFLYASAYETARLQQRMRLCGRDAEQLHVIEVALVESWRLLAARLPMHSLNRCPANIREWPIANIRRLFRTLTDGPSLVQPSACLWVCNCTSHACRAGQTTEPRFATKVKAPEDI